MLRKGYNFCCLLYSDFLVNSTLFTLHYSLCFAKVPPPTGRELKQEFDVKFHEESFNQLLEKRKSLPVYNYKGPILDVVKAHQVVIIKGATGCGKTTQIPQYVLDEFIMGGDGTNCNIVVTQVIFLKPVMSYIS